MSISSRRPPQRPEVEFKPEPKETVVPAPAATPSAPLPASRVDVAQERDRARADLEESFNLRLKHAQTQLAAAVAELVPQDRLKARIAELEAFIRRSVHNGLNYSEAGEIIKKVAP